MVLFIFMLILIGSGFLAERVFSLISNSKKGNGLITGLVFSFLIFTTNILGIHVFRDLATYEKLEKFMGNVVYSMKFAILSILVGLVFAIISGMVGRLCFWRSLGRLSGNKE